MQVVVIKMRELGVEIPHRMLSDRYTYKHRGSLVIMDTTDQDLRRPVKIARLQDAGVTSMSELLDPHILWANDNRFVLAGFERLKNEAGRLVRASPRRSRRRRSGTPGAALQRRPSSDALQANRMTTARIARLVGEEDEVGVAPGIGEVLLALAFVDVFRDTEPRAGIRGLALGALHVTQPGVAALQGGRPAVAIGAALYPLVQPEVVPHHSADGPMRRVWLWSAQLRIQLGYLGGRAVHELRQSTAVVPGGDFRTVATVLANLSDEHLHRSTQAMHCLGFAYQRGDRTGLRHVN